MIAIPSRHKSLTLLAAVVVTQILLLAVQIKSERQVRLIRVWAMELISPLQRLGSWTVNGASHSWGGYVGLRSAQKENEAMRAELDRLKVRNAELEGRALEADRLAALLKFHNAHTEAPMIAARVIGASPDSGSLVVSIDRGSRDGIRRDMGVITPDGVVGKILAVYPDISQVLLLGDKESGVGALLADTRTQGPVKGTGEPLLSLDYISSDEKVTVGEAVLTSGTDRIFPKDLPVGKVVDFVTDPKSPFMRIRVKPAAHLDRLEEVLVLETRQELIFKKSPDTDTSPVESPGAPRAALAPAGAKKNQGKATDRSGANEKRENMDSTEVYIGPEPHIEVHKYYTGVVPIAVLLALVLQAFFPVYIRSANYLELPLLVTLYFALSKRNPSSGLLLGMVVGLLQDSLSRTPLGLYGIAKTLVGYLGSSIGSRIDVEHPVSRFLLTAGFCLFHHAVFTLTTRALLAQRNESYLTLPIVIAALVNAVIAVGLFPLLDKFRKPS